MHFDTTILQSEPPSGDRLAPSPPPDLTPIFEGWWGCEWVPLRTFFTVPLRSEAGLKKNWGHQQNTFKGETKQRIIKDNSYLKVMEDIIVMT